MLLCLNFMAIPDRNCLCIFSTFHSGFICPQTEVQTVQHIRLVGLFRKSFGLVCDLSESIIIYFILLQSLCLSVLCYSSMETLTRAMTFCNNIMLFYELHIKTIAAYEEILTIAELMVLLLSATTVNWLTQQYPL